MTQLLFFEETTPKSKQAIMKQNPSKQDIKLGDFIIVKGMTLHVDNPDHEGDVLASDKKGREFIIPHGMIDAVSP
jgi:hypothetical protein